MIKYLFFDFDGTICDSRSNAEISLIRTLDKFECDFNHSKAISLLGDKINITLQKVCEGEERVNKIAKYFHKQFTKENLIDVRPCVPLNYLYRLSKKYKMIIISNSDKKHIVKALNKLKIKKLFKKVYGAQNFSTKDEMLTKLIKKYKINQKEAVYIGDRFSDIRYAKKAGCISIAMSNSCSWSDKKTLKKEKPDYFVKDFVELGRLLDKINK